MFAARNPRSAKAYEAADHLFGRVPMTWMNKRAGGFPLYLATAHGARVTDLDGHSYVDLCLGDTGAMAGHSPGPVVEAVRRRMLDEGGLTAMMPTEDAAWVGTELARRFGLPYWSFSLTATDANRWAMRLARALTGRSKVLFNSYCYHGSVDESLIVLDDEGRPASRAGNVGAPSDVLPTSRVAEFNDLDGLDRELSHGDVAAVLMEPALTNIGIVLPLPGYLDGVREVTRAHGTLLILDETHTFSAGPGGATGLWRAAARHADDRQGDRRWRAVRCVWPVGRAGRARPGYARPRSGGHGRRGWHAGRQSGVLAAARACLGEVLTDAAFAHMIALGRPARRRRFGPPSRRRAAVVRVPARCPGGVPVRGPATPDRQRIQRGRRPGARRLPSRLRREPRRAADAVSQHGADVPGDDGGRHRPYRRCVRRALLDLGARGLA